MGSHQRRSSVNSGWKEVAINRPSRTATATCKALILVRTTFDYDTRYMFCGYAAGGRSSQPPPLGASCP
eukprot:787984-Prorocentrum_minimum.AAC.1